MKFKIFDINYSDSYVRSPIGYPPSSWSSNHTISQVEGLHPARRPRPWGGVGRTVDGRFLFLLIINE
jgi:hypothetical protein